MVACEQYAFHVFSMSVATVIGQTQPGVGVIPFTNLCKSSKSESHWAMPSIKVFPTSITMDSSLTISRVISQGTPAATMTISAFLVFSLKFIVVLLQVVTVAPALISMSVMGFPTILDRPMTVTFFPTKPIS